MLGHMTIRAKSTDCDPHNHINLGLNPEFSVYTMTFYLLIILETFTYSKKLFKNGAWDFPGVSVVKNPPANVEDMGSLPALGRFYLLPGNKAPVP